MVGSTYEESFNLRERYQYVGNLGERIETDFGDFKFIITHNNGFRFEDYFQGEKGEVLWHYPNHGRVNGAFYYNIDGYRLVLLYDIYGAKNPEKPKTLRQKFRARLFGQDLIGPIILDIEELPRTSKVSDEEEVELSKFFASPECIEEIVNG